jgi:hypothetical protein
VVSLEVSQKREHTLILAREFETNKEIFRSRPSLRSSPRTSAVFGPVVALGTILGMVIEKTHDNDSMAIVRESKAKRERTPFYGKRIRNLKKISFARARRYAPPRARRQTRRSMRRGALAGFSPSATVSTCFLTPPTR